MQGRSCRTEPLDPTKHGADLWQAVSLDKDTHNWTYLPYGPFAAERDYRAWLESVAGKDDPQYAYSDRERDGLVRLGTESGKRLPKEGGIQRFKGLGEMPAKELWDTTMDPDRRVLLQVTLDDAAAADDLFSVLMGEDVEQRRSFIQRNAKDVRFLDI